MNIKTNPGRNRHRCHCYIYLAQTSPLSDSGWPTTNLPTPLTEKKPPPPPRVATAQPTPRTAWEEVRAQLAAVLGAPATDDHPPPFNAASDVPIDQQKEECMKNIQKLMSEHKFEDSIGMFRAAREVWPEEGIFGFADIEEDEELNMLETIYNTDLGVEITVDAAANEETQENSEYDDEDEEEEEETTAAIVESDFDFPDFVRRFCNPRVVSACASVLERYEKNLPATNHCAVKMLHRVAYDCTLPAMLYQGSLFTTFQKILANPHPQHKELEKFAIFILRKFAEAAARDSKVFIELLFWKTSKDAIEIQHGYDLYTDHKDKPGKGAWSEEQEEEIKDLYMENQRNPENDKDVIDWILENLIDQTRTRRSVIKKLKELGLIFRAPTKRSNKDRATRDNVPKEFTEEEDEILRQVWDQCRENDDPMSELMGRMPYKRPKRVLIERLLELGIVHDKKECRKKRQKKSKSNTGAGDGKSDDSSDSDNSGNSDSDDDRPNSPKPVPIKKKPNKKDNKKKELPKSKKTPKPVELSANEIAKLLVEAVDKGHTEALKWLAENLEEVALDQEAEGFDPAAEATPLVPVSKDSVQAMESDLFKKVLKGVGVMPPSDEQERYWRIPSALHFETIRKRREIVMKAVNKELIVDTTETVAEEETAENNAESSDDDNLFDNLRKMTDTTAESSRKSNPPSNRKRSRSVESDDANSREKMPKIDEDEETKDESRDEDILSFAKKTIQHDDLPDTEDILSNIARDHSDESDDDGEIMAVKRNNKKRRVVIDDDSD